MHIRCPHCHNAIEIVEDSSFRDVECPSCGSNFNLVGSDKPTESGPAKPQRLAHFELIEQLGVGHFGAVWKAKDTTLDRFVAIKIPRKEQLDEEDIEKFFREARAAAQLRHPNIVGVHEVGREGDTIFIASDFVDGATLAEWLGGQPLPPREAAQLCAKIADALHIAHESGVVHRDLKPQNIMMDLNGEPHVMDFGLAKRDAGEITVTVEGALLGTPAYMPPEQAAGRGHEADRRSDVYSLGVILFQMLTGELPFRGEKRMLLVQIQRDEPPSPRKLNGNVPRDLETICLKCLEKPPEGRYQSALDLSSDLERFLDGRPIKARRTGRMVRGWRWAKRNPTAAALVFLVLVIAVVGPVMAVRQTILRRNLEEMLQARIDAQTTALLNADVQAVPSILRQLAKDLEVVLPQLEYLQTQGELTEDQRLRVRLALVQSDERIAAELADQLLTTSLEYVPVVTAALEPHQEKVTAALWREFHTKPHPDGRRFRAGMALAALDADSAQWSDQDDEFLVRQLVATNPDYQPALRNMMVGRRDRVVGPLERVFADEQSEGSHRLAATRALAVYLKNNAPRLARLTSEASSEQYALLFPLLRDSASQDVKNTLADLAAEQPSEKLAQEERIKLGKRRAGAAISVLRLGEFATGYGAFQFQDDPESLTQFVHGCRDHEVTADVLVQSLQSASDLHSRYAMLLALGDYPLADINALEREALVQQLIESYRNDPSSAIHGATGWLLRQWSKGEEVSRIDRTEIVYDEKGEREWFVARIPVQSATSSGSGDENRDTESANGNIYITFIVFRPGRIQFGTEESSPDVRMPRTFAVSDREITWEQFDPSDNGNSHRVAEEALSSHKKLAKLMPDEPACGMNWFMAVEYCRWLSQQAEIRESNQCYEEKESLPCDEKGNPTNWSVHLDRPGFRLLTEAEWQYVCRSDTRTRYSFGNDQSLLAHYGWFVDNSAEKPHATGLLRPNLRGLFDLHGNVHEWCHDWRGRDSEGDARDVGGPSEGTTRRMRGGSYGLEARICSSIWRDQRAPAYRSTDMGFRIAVTLESDQDTDYSEAHGDEE